MVVERSHAGIHRGETLAERVLLASLREGRAVEFVARGASMWPAVRSGATVRVQPCPAASLRPADLAAFERDGRLVVHRVVSVGPRGVLFRGDALACDDGLVPVAAVLGRADVARQPPLRLALPRPRHLLAAARAAGSVMRALSRRWRRGATL